MKAILARCCFVVCILCAGATAAAADSGTPPLVSPTDTANPSANLLAPDLAMPPGTQGAPGTATTPEKRPTRAPIADTVAPPPPATVSATKALSTSPAAAPATPPASAPSAPTVADQLALRQMVEATRESLADHSVKPPPPKITVKSGVTEVIPIAIGRMNRFLTPFRDPVIKTTSTASISRSGNIVYVATDTSDSVSLFVIDKADPEQAISLTLTPASIPPVQVQLTLEGYEPKAAPVLDRGAEKANGVPYVEAVKALMRDLALHRIPEGFAMASIAKVAKSDLPRCRMPNVDVHVAQVLEGHAMEAFVARAVNASIDATEVDESACAGEKVLAVSAWPRTHLEPGQDTELYIVVRHVDRTDAPADRPSVLRSGE